MKKMEPVKIAFQESDTRLYSIEEKHLTKEELDKLIVIMPNTRWIIINWCDPSGILHSPDSFDGDKLPDGTLKTLAEGEPLTETDRLSIKNATIN